MTYVSKAEEYDAAKMWQRYYSRHMEYKNVNNVR